MTHETIVTFSLSFSMYHICIFFFKYKFPNFFGICESNEKTSLKHETMSRGLGLFFIITLLPFIVFYQNIFDFKDLLLITVSCFVGFWDDKKSLSQIFKLKILFIIAFCYSLTLQDFNSFETMFSLNFILFPFYFLFMILFFNQIDGINGLAGITFIVTLFIFSFFSNNIFILMPIIGAVIGYLSLNLRGAVGIQGEAGSFFMGAVIFVISSKIVFPFHSVFSIIFLFPVLIDISATTIVRYYLKNNILEGHRSNLYQKLVAKYKKPAVISFVFGFLH